MMKKIIPILVLLLMIGFFMSGCVSEPITEDTDVDTELSDVGGEIDDFDDINEGDYDLDDIDIEDDFPII